MTNLYLKSQLASGLHVAPALEVKFAAGDGAFEGYASTFGGAPDMYGDIILPGAFTASLARHKGAGTLPVMLWSHRPDEPIGRWTSLVEDSKGLAVAGRLNLETTAGQDAYAHLKHGDVSGLSIGFQVMPGGRVPNKDGTSNLKQVELHEISVVAVPANASARVHQVKHLESRADLEELLRKNGLANGAARKITAGGWPALTQDDPQPTPNPLLEQLAARLGTATAELKSFRRS